jgi:hypothetical protein
MRLMDSEAVKKLGERLREEEDDRAQGRPSRWSKRSAEQYGCELGVVASRLRAGHESNPLAVAVADLVEDLGRALVLGRDTAEMKIALRDATRRVRDSIGDDRRVEGIGKYGAVAKKLRAVVEHHHRCGDGIDAIAEVLADLSLNARGYKAVLPFPNGGDRAARKKALRDALLREEDLHDEPPGAGRAVVVCARAAGFKRPSKLFNGEQERHRRQRVRREARAARSG